MRSLLGSGLVIAAASAASAACSSNGERSSPPPPPSTYDAGPADAGPDATGECKTAGDFPCAHLVYARGEPARLYHAIVPYYSEELFPTPLLASHAGADEMPSFDASGEKLAFVRTPSGGGKREIRVVSASGGEDSIVATCAGGCEDPSFTADGSVWFIERGPTGQGTPMRVRGGAAVAPAWAAELSASSCVLRSLRPTFERDAVVLSLSSADTGSSDASSPPPTGPCPPGAPRVVVVPLEAISLPASRAISDAKYGPSTVVTRATASSKTARIYGIARDPISAPEPRLFVAFGDGEVFKTSSSNCDAFDLIDPTDEDRTTFVSRAWTQNEGGSRFQLELSAWIKGGSGASVVGLRHLGYGIEVSVSDLGTPTLSRRLP